MDMVYTGGDSFFSLLVKWTKKNYTFNFYKNISVHNYFLYALLKNKLFKRYFFKSFIKKIQFFNSVSFLGKRRVSIRPIKGIKNQIDKK